MLYHLFISITNAHAYHKRRRAAFIPFAFSLLTFVTYTGRKPLPPHLLKKQPRTTPGAPRAPGWRKWVRGTEYLDSNWEPVALKPDEAAATAAATAEADAAAAAASAAAADLAAAANNNAPLPKLVIRLRRMPSAAGAAGGMSLSHSQGSESHSSMWSPVPSERSELMTSSYSMHPDDSLPPLSLPVLPLGASGGVHALGMSLSMPPSGTELNSPRSPLLPLGGLDTEPTPRSPPLVLEESNVAELNSFFDDAPQPVYTHASMEEEEDAAATSALAPDAPTDLGTTLASASTATLSTEISPPASLPPTAAAGEDDQAGAI